ncbi:MAG: CRP/FNR family cyclic AMP-dependent transcriptional regulator [Desulforhopalus sp.]|jgi:CRP/FNR family cyclic AMP-dependent transcriptional regulator
MKNFSALFTIIEERNCPLYRAGESLILSEKTIICPKGKEVCLILVRDMTQILFQILASSGKEENAGIRIYNCSGCTGLIKFQLQSESEQENNKKTGSGAQIDPATQILVGQVKDAELFQSFSESELLDILSHFRVIDFVKDGLIIKKGELNLNLYMVVSGELVVEDDGVPLAFLKKGELCGEMSYLGADVAVSSVRVKKNTKVLAIEGDVFGEIMRANTSVQNCMAQLLARRLRKTNAARTRDFESCMSGRIDQIAPAELLQIFHMHQKTGVLTLQLPDGEAKVSFREGCIINASYGKHSSEEAIFSMLAEKKGVYRFTVGLSPSEMKAAEIGDFMMLLMEGVKRVDEEKGEE